MDLLQTFFKVCLTDPNIGYLYLYFYTYLVCCLLCGVGSSSLIAWMATTLLLQSSLSSIAPGRSSNQHWTSLQSCFVASLSKVVLWGYMFCGALPTLLPPCFAVHGRMLVIILSLALQQCPANLQSWPKLLDTEMKFWHVFQLSSNNWRHIKFSPPP